MPKIKVLYIASEISPFLNTSAVADFVSALPRHIKAKGMDFRIIVPRFGVINERTNRLHEVVRLSGPIIKVGNETKNLVIKVSSVPKAKIQVYFVDNEDYFKRRAILHDKNDLFFEDNDERIVFFCKGALETVKKLEWTPDVIHCHGWMTSLIPMYLKTAYRNDPFFKKAPVIFTLYNNTFSHKFERDFIETARMPGMRREKMELLQSADFGALVKIGAQHADFVARAEALDDPNFKGLFEGRTFDLLENNEEGLEAYHDLYIKLAAVRRKKTAAAAATT